MMIDDVAREEIYKAYLEKVTGHVCAKIANPSDREDVISEVFLKICKKYDTFDESRASLGTWIFHITKNTVIDYYRTHRLYGELSEYSEAAAWNREMPREEELETLADALKALDKRERNIIILHYYKGISLKTIAEETGVSYTYTKVLHGKALKNLKKFFE